MSTSAFLLIIVTAVFHALWNIALKKVSGDITVIWSGLVIICIISIPFMFFILPSTETLRSIFLLTLASGIIHAVYFFTLTKAYEAGEISVVYPIARGSGIAGTAIAAVLIIDENVTFLGTIGILAICIGILLIGFKNYHLRKSIFFALFVGVTIIAYSIIDKQVVAISDPLFFMFAFTLLSTLILTPYIIFKKKQQLLITLRSKKKYSGLIGLCSMGTYLIILYVFQVAQVSYVIAIRELSVAIAALIGFVVFREKFTIKKVLGILVIVLGIVLIKITGMD